MNKPGPVPSAEGTAAAPVFISYASADRKEALAVCEAIERRGIRCWISCRDVGPGENYQEAIVVAIQTARAVVLVFSEAANNSNEIKKELSLASRFGPTVIALRIEDVEPSNAFAYELSTRQWIDAFDDWNRSVDALVNGIAGSPHARPATIAADRNGGRRERSFVRRPIWAATAGLLVLMLFAGAWWLLRPTRAAAHSMTVRLTGFKALSADLPAGIHDAVNSEIVAAFNADGVVGVSTASAPAPGSAPAYALDGTIHRIGNSVRVITRFSNERTGAILWSDSVDYPAEQASKVPHKIAVDAGTVVRCGLFGASTYRKSLPDAVLANYMQYCQQYWAFGGSKTLRFAQLVAAAAPDFSWGWSAVGNGYLQASELEPDSRRAEELRAAGRQAEDRAVALDPSNSEALAHKSYLIDRQDWLAQEKLFKSAIAAKPLDCGCEHYGYGLMLQNVGRVGDAIEQFRQATDMLALWSDSEFALADALVASGRQDESRPHLAAAIDLSGDPDFDKWAAQSHGTETGEYGAAIKVLRDPRFHIAEPTRAALLSGYEALASDDSAAKMKAVQLLLALPKEEQSDTVPTMLAALGANHEALALASGRPSLFWRRSMRGVLNDAAFPAVVNRLGLLRYWKTTQTKPDVCTEKDTPRFCSMI